MTFVFVPLALLMWAMTYPARALPMLAPGMERLPARVATYLQLAGPAALAALAAVNVLFLGSNGRFQLGLEPLAVVLGAGVTAWRRSLLPGVIVAAVIVAAARTAGFA